MSKVDFQTKVLEFLENPEKFSFEDLYQTIFGIWQTEKKNEIKPEITNVITTIFDRLFTANQQEEEDNINLLKRQLDEYIHNIALLTNIFSFYDSQVESGEKVSDIAVQIILTKYFQIETTVTTLQNDVSEIFKQFLRNQIEIPESLKLISKFIYTINNDLYKRIFDQAFTNEINFYATTLNLEELNVFDQINSLYDIYMRVYENLSVFFQPSTGALFKELFCKGVMKKDNLMDKILCEQTFLENDNPETLGHLYYLVRLSPGQWEKIFVSIFASNIVHKLDTIIEKIKETKDESQSSTQSGPFIMNTDQFASFGEQTAKLISETRSIIIDYLNDSEIVSNATWNTFSRFLRDQNFPHQLCLFIDQTMQPLPFFDVLCPFLKNDPNFEENYGIFMTRRLLHNPNRDAELELMSKFEESGIDLHQLSLMLDDFSKAPHVETKFGENNEIDVSLLVLYKFCWSPLHVPEFEPPEFFTSKFNEALAASEFDTSRKVIRMCDRYSTVEFGNGEQTFSLPFVHACILQTILEKGPMLRIQLSTELKMKENLLTETVNALIHTKILGEDQNHRLFFIGPPTEESLVQTDGNSDAEFNIASRVQDDPVLYSDCNDQIDAAIMFLFKQKRFAKVEEIHEAVYKTVPSKFPVTDAKIQACLQKLLDREYIMHHGGNTQYYRICKHT